METANWKVGNSRFELEDGDVKGGSPHGANDPPWRHQCRAANHATTGEPTELYGVYQNESGMSFVFCRIKVATLLIFPNCISATACSLGQGYGVRQKGLWLFISMMNRGQPSPPGARMTRVV